MTTATVGHIRYKVFWACHECHACALKLWICQQFNPIKTLTQNIFFWYENLFWPLSANYCVGFLEWCQMVTKSIHTLPSLRPLTNVATTNYHKHRHPLSLHYNPSSPTELSLAAALYSYLTKEKCIDSAWYSHKTGSWISHVKTQLTLFK